MMTSIMTAVLITAMPTVPVGEVLSVQGEAALLSKGAKETRPIRLGSALHEGDTITTKSGGFVQLLLQEDNVLTVGPHSRLVITQSLVKKNTLTMAVNLVKGTMRALIGNIFGRKVRFEVTTKTAVAGVRGTYFIARADEQGSLFHSLNGTLEIKDPQGTLRMIHSGQSVSATPTGLAAVTTLPQANVSALMQATPPTMPISNGEQAAMLTPSVAQPSAPVVAPRPVSANQSGISLSIEAPPPTPAAPQGFDVYLDFPQ